MAAISVPRTDFDPKWFRLPMTGPRRARSVGLLSVFLLPLLLGATYAAPALILLLFINLRV